MNAGARVICSQSGQYATRLKSVSRCCFLFDVNRSALPPERNSMQFTCERLSTSAGPHISLATETAAGKAPLEVPLLATLSKFHSILSDDIGSANEQPERPNWNVLFFTARTIFQYKYNQRDVHVLWLDVAEIAFIKVEIISKYNYT